MSCILKFNKTTLLNQILTPLSKFTERVKLQIKDGKLSALTHTSSADVIFYATTDCDIKDNVELNLPDIAKLIRVIGCIERDEIELQLKSNKLEYSTKELKFNYHLLDNAVMAKCVVTAEKINTFQYDSQFTITSHKITEVLKNSVFASETEKIYFIQNNNEINIELGDREIANTDNLTFLVSTDANEETPLTKIYPIKIETLRYFAGLKYDKITVKVNNSKRILCFEINGNVNIKYIVSALVK